MDSEEIKRAMFADFISHVIYGKYKIDTNELSRSIDEYLKPINHKSSSTINRLYIGLIDKNGVKIHEGDMCKFGSGIIRKIEFFNGGFGFWSEREKDYFVSFSGHSDFNELMKHIEVVST